MRDNRKMSDVIPAELTDTPIMSLTGDREITVDGFRGIEEYTDDCVTFRAGKLNVCVSGSGLEIRYMSLHTIVIGGSIRSVGLM